MPAKARRNVDRVFGAVLRKSRLHAGLSQQDLAHAAGCHPTFISMLERGVATLSLVKLMAIADVLDVRASDLVRNTEDALRGAPARARIASDRPR